MASTTKRAWILALFLVIAVILPFSTVTVARLLHEGRNSDAAVQVKFNTSERSQRLLHQLGFDHSKLEHYRKLSATLMTDRRGPGGPDPQHH